MGRGGWSEDEPMRQLALPIAMAAAALAAAGCAAPTDPQEEAQLTLWVQAAGFTVLLIAGMTVVGLVVALLHLLDREPRPAVRRPRALMTEEQYWGERYAAREPTPASLPA